MGNEDKVRADGPKVPDTTQKQEGTTSAFSAASMENGDLRKQGGTDAEHDDITDTESPNDDTIGIP